jgi:hypothetical protein
MMRWKKYLPLIPQISRGLTTTTSEEVNQGNLVAATINSLIEMTTTMIPVTSVQCTNATWAKNTSSAIWALRKRMQWVFFGTEDQGSPHSTLASAATQELERQLLDKQADATQDKDRDTPAYLNAYIKEFRCDSEVLIEFINICTTTTDVKVAWFWDSGASSFVTSNKHFLTNFQPFNIPSI